MFKKTRGVRRIIERYRQELKNFTINSQKIILYGSYVKGNPREDSDIDLIVISDDFKEWHNTFNIGGDIYRENLGQETLSIKY